MILDRPESWYIFILRKDYFKNPNGPPSYMTYNGNQLTNKEYLEHWGKWVFIGEKSEIHDLAQKMDPHVESGAIPCAKYDRDPQRWATLEHCVMCVYCDDRQREEVINIMISLGVKGRRWVYEREVIQKWLPGGLHMEAWIKANNLTEEEAEKVREESRQEFKIFFDRPDDICLGWKQ